MLEPLYLPDGFFCFYNSDFFRSMVVKVLGVRRPREINKFIFYFSNQIKLLRYSLSFELLNFAEVVVLKYFTLVTCCQLGNGLAWMLVRYFALCQGHTR